MDNINWEMVGVILVMIGMQSGVLLVAAKAIFVTKSKIYDDRGMSIFVPREEMKSLCQERRDNFEAALKALSKIAATVVSRCEWEGSYKEREKRHNEDQKRLCKKLDILQNGQVGIEKALSKLYGLLEQENDT